MEQVYIWNHLVFMLQNYDYWHQLLNTYASESSTLERKLSFSTGGDNSELVRQLNDYKSTITQLKAALEESSAANIEKKLSSTTQSISHSAEQVSDFYLSALYQKNHWFTITDLYCMYVCMYVLAEFRRPKKQIANPDRRCHQSEVGMAIRGRSRS